jgi:hypothetical protein
MASARQFELVSNRQSNQLRAYHTSRIETREGNVKDLLGKVAVVTGAASGIGRGLAERFATKGTEVVLADVEAVALANLID